MPIRKASDRALMLQIPNPEFEGQTKTRLGNPEVRKLVDTNVAAVGLAHVGTKSFQPLHRMGHGACLGTCGQRWLSLPCPSAVRAPPSSCDELATV